MIVTARAGRATYLGQPYETHEIGKELPGYFNNISGNGNVYNETEVEDIILVRIFKEFKEYDKYYDLKAKYNFK